MQPKSFSYPSMGTTWKVTIWDDISDARLSEIEKQVRTDSADFDRTYSRFIATSLVCEIAKKAGTYTVPEHFMNMLTWYMNLYDISGRHLNPLIGFTISDLGYDAEYSLETKNVIRATPDLKEAVKIVDDGVGRTIETSQPVLFDFGALGKGYFVDVISKYLKSLGIRRYMADGSGDIYYEGNGEKIRAGLEDPRDATQAIGVWEIERGSICGSGINRRKWSKYNHVVDPLESDSVSGDIQAVWVKSDKAVLSDALATCLFFVDPEVLRQEYDFEYLILNNEYKIKHSAGMKAELFYE